MTADPRPLPPDLREVAAAHGVATSYRNERRVPVDVDADVVIRVLALLDVDAGTESSRRHELAKLADRERAGVVAPTIAVRVDGQPRPMPGAASLVGEDGACFEVHEELPGELIPGWYPRSCTKELRRPMMAPN